MYLLGGSGHCKVIIDIIQKSKLDFIEGIIDNNPIRNEIFNIPIIKQPNIDFFNSISLIISIGDNRIRKRIVNQISTHYLTAIHPSSIIAKNVIIEEGTVIMANTILNPDVKIGKHCIINSGAVIEHDCHLENYVHVSPNVALAGNVIIGEGAHIGIGACVIQGIKIGKWTKIGAGTVVIKDIPDYAVVVGNPGRVIKFNEDENEEN
jgi:sugar O-acyltransferase (sialic acid O-acetyltransferase NeuD family)